MYVSELRSRVESHLVHVLLGVAVAEMTVYRLLVPSLRPKVDVAPAWWHTSLTYFGLFLFYFASALAVGVVAQELRDLYEQRAGRARSLIWLVLPGAACFLVVATLSVVAVPSASLGFLLEGEFVLTVVLVVIIGLVRGGDIGARLGLLLLALPLVVHFYGPVSVRYIAGDEAIFDGLTDQIDQTGRWMVLFVALAMPYLFGARPFLVHAARIPPVFSALAVGLMGASLVRHDFHGAMRLAENGLGFSIGVAAPGSMIALCLLALSAVVWTLVNCLTAPTSSRRQIGAGIALVVVGGYAFTWPLQYLCGLAGLLAIVRAIPSLREQERASLGVSIPAIEDEDWQRYVTSVLEALRPSASEPSGKMVTVRGEGGQSRSHFACIRDDLDITVTIERIAGSIVGIDVRCGSGEVSGKPVWTLHTAAPTATGIMHPRPPACEGPRHHDSDAEFDKSFVLADAASWSERLLDDELRARLHSDIGGWIAIWANGTLRFQVYPGRGAAMDHPIPILALAMKTGNSGPEAMVSLIDVLAQLARRAHTLAESKD